MEAKRTVKGYCYNNLLLWFGYGLSNLQGFMCWNLSPCEISGGWKPNPTMVFRGLAFGKWLGFDKIIRVESSIIESWWLYKEGGMLIDWFILSFKNTFDAFLLVRHIEWWCPFHKSCWNLIPNATVLRGVAFGKGLSHEGWAPSCLSFHAFCHEATMLLLSGGCINKAPYWKQRMALTSSDFWIWTSWSKLWETSVVPQFHIVCVIHYSSMYGLR